MASDPNNKPVFIQAMQKNNYAPAKDMEITSLSRWTKWEIWTSKEN